MTDPQQPPEKRFVPIRLCMWALRLSSILLCSATFTVGIYLELTKDGVLNRGGPIPLLYIALVWFLLLTLLEFFALPPTQLQTYRLPPPVLVFNELIAIMFASIAAAFDDWRYICTDCPDGESYPVPTMWRQETALIVTTITLHGVLAGLAVYDWPSWTRMKREKKEEKQRRLDVLALSMPAMIV